MLSIFPFKKNTIRNILMRYFSTIILLLALLAVAMYFIVLHQDIIYRNLLDETQQLNTFFLYTNDTQQKLENYVRANSDETLQLYKESINKMKDKSNNLSTLQSIGDKRIVRDLQGIVYSYAEQAEKVVQSMSKEDFSLTKEKLLLSRKTNIYISKNFQNCYLVLLTAQEKIEDANHEKNQFCYFIILLCILTDSLLCIIFSSTFAQSISTPLIKLTRVSSKVLLYDYKIHVDENEGTEEMQILAREFNQMLATIQQQIQELNNKADLERKIKEKEIEILKVNHTIRANQLTLLQSQINPHFLFNTINIIYEMAYIENADKTSEILQIFADYYRYNLNNFNKIVSVQDEIENAASYIYLQKKRFGSLFSYMLDLEGDMDLTTYAIPCLILQPLLENTIAHGIRSHIEDGKININLSLAENHNLIIRIEDNGIGMTDEKMNEFNNYHIDKKTTLSRSIGVKNVLARMDLFYEGLEKVSFSPTTPHGTLITLTIPKKEISNV